MFGSARYLLLLPVFYGLLDRAYAEAHEKSFCFRWDKGFSENATNSAKVQMDCERSSVILTADLTNVSFYKSKSGISCPETVGKEDCQQRVDRGDIKYRVDGGLDDSTCSGSSSCLVYYAWPQSIPVSSKCQGKDYLIIGYTCDLVSEQSTTSMDSNAHLVTDESSPRTTLGTGVATTTTRTTNKATVEETNTQTNSAFSDLVTIESSSGGRKPKGDGLLTEVVITLLVSIFIVALLVALIVCCWKRHGRKDNDQSPGPVRWSSTAPSTEGYVTVDSGSYGRYAIPSVAVSNTPRDQPAVGNSSRYATQPTSEYAEPFQPIITLNKPGSDVSGNIYAQPIKRRKPGHADDGQRWNQTHAQTAQRDMSNCQDFITDSEENDLILTENDLYSPGVYS